MKNFKEQFYFLVSATMSLLISYRNLLRRIIGLTSKKIESILVVKLDEIGDMVYALHVFEHLKIQYSDAPITLLCKPFVKPLVQNNPAISNIIHQIPSNEKFDLVVELRGNWDTMKYAIDKMPNRRLDRGTVRFLNKLKGGQKHEVITNFEVIKSLLPKGTKPFVPKIEIDENTKVFIEEFILEKKLQNFVVIHCGARRKLRQWPVENFASLIKILEEKYKLQIVFAGTEEDEPVINEIIKLSKIEAVVCTRNFSLLHFADLVKRAKLFVGNESGPLHIAAVMKTPLVGIYGPGVPGVFYPIGDKSKVVHHILNCNPCDQVHCVRPENPCINLVTLLEVEQNISEILSV